VVLRENTNSSVVVNPFTGADVAAILAEHGWATVELSAWQVAWCERAAAILGVHAADRDALAELLELVFHYDPREILRHVESHAVLSRYAARDVLRQLALLLLEGTALNSDRFKELLHRSKRVWTFAGGSCFIRFGWRWRGGLERESWIG